MILPNAVSFQDAVPSITFEEQNGNSKAYLTYEFAGQIVGKASITLDENTEEEETVHYYLPLQCYRCSLFIADRAKRKAEEAEKPDNI